PPRLDPYLADAQQAAAAQQPSGPDYGAMLDHLATDAQQFFGSYAGASQAKPDAPIYQSRRPDLEPPPGSVTFANVNVIATPANDGLDHAVLTFTVPNGWDGQILQLANVYTGVGFNLATIGNLTWRIL